jgi:hypothetical protein
MGSHSGRILSAFPSSPLLPQSAIWLLSNIPATVDTDYQFRTIDLMHDKRNKSNIL